MNQERENMPMAGDLSPFERIRRLNAVGVEYWSSRDFAVVLGYSDYRNFEAVLGKARLACFNSGHRIEDHFVSERTTEEDQRLLLRQEMKMHNIRLAGTAKVAGVIA